MTQATINYILDQCDERCIEVSISHSKSYYGESLWSWDVTLECRRDGVELKVEKSSKDYRAAVAEAWAQFNATANHGLPALLAPVVEHARDEDETPPMRPLS